MRRVVASVVVALSALTLTPSSGADFLIVTQGGKYTPGDNCINLRPVQLVPCAALALTIPAGSTLTFRNQDNDPHSVTADGLDALGRPLFDAYIGLANQSAPVVGVASLQPGTYPFHCYIHSMTGKLEVI